MPLPDLPAAPDALLDEQGQPRFGRYQGQIGQLDWQRMPLSRWQRILRPLRHKRWQYLALTHPDYIIGLAVVDVGWTGAAFAYLFDRRAARLLADVSAESFPRHQAHVSDHAFGAARYDSPKLRICFGRQDGYLAVTVTSAQLQLAAHISVSQQTPVLAAIAPGDWRAHSTHKSGALEVSGFADCQGQRFSLDGAIASLDYSNGLLARQTAWRWASAHRAGLGFNLQQGYMGDGENALWMDRQLFPLAGVTFDYDPAQPLRPWQIHSDDGLLALQFTPEGLRSKNQNLLIASSRYIQVIGRFDGHISHPVSQAVHIVQNLAGVTEDHFARW